MTPESFLERAPDQHSLHSLLPKSAHILGACVVLLLLHRYPGIVHDAILYMGEGLARRSPTVFAHDLFFLHGGQDQYSLMPALLGWLLQWWPAPQVFMWGALGTLLLFGAASWFALRALLPDRQRAWAWLGIACLPSIYGVVSIFGYNEAFLTSRPLAEALCLFGIGWLARGRWGPAGLCFGVALLLHPLQAVAAALVAWCWAVTRDRRWWHALWGMLPLLLLAWMGVAPFDGLLRPFDPEWLAAVRMSSHLFVSSWGVADYKTLGFDVFLLATATVLLPDGWRQWCKAALMGLAMGLGASLLLADGLHLVLPTGLQLWRVHWVAHWFAIASLAGLLFRHVMDRDIGRALALMLAAQLAWGETTLGVVALSLLYVAWPWLVAPPRERLRPLLAWILGSALVLLFVNHATNEWKWFMASGMELARYPLDIRLLMFPAVAFGLPLAGLWLWQRASGYARLAVFAAGLVPTGCWAAVTWDARKPQDLAFELQADQHSLFGTYIPPTAQVFWIPENLLGNWLILGRASYYSDSQMAGQMFNRATAIEGIRKAAKLRPLREASLRCLRDHATAEGQMHCQIDDQAIFRACAPGAPAPPDFIVMPHIQPGVQAWRWDVRDPTTGQIALSYRLYQCEALLHAQRVHAHSNTAVSE